MFPRDAFTLDAPTFPRLDEYAGVWAIEMTAGSRLVEMFRSFDFTAHAAALPTAPAPAGYLTVPAKPGKSVAILSATGPLMKQRASTGGTSTIDLRRNLRSAVQDPDVSGILLAIDSPGGTTAGTQALADEIKQASRKKPVWAQVEDAGYSAAYWIASQASQVFASTPTTGVGSVGTYLVVKSQPTSDGKTAAAVRVFRSGPLKGIGEDDLTDEQAGHLQRWIEELNTHFVKAVATGRGLDKATMDELAKGGSMLAAEAKDKRLIDGIRPMEKTLAALAAL